MADEQQVAWQENRTLSERFRYILDNAIGTDVCFEIGPSEGNVDLVRAHKAFLIASSPVFEAMFTGGMAESSADCGNIRIPDIDVTMFKEMLRYTYCETANITTDTALPLMYAAKKYLLTGLATECRRVLEEGLSVTTVCTILDGSMALEENELKLKCLNFIAKNAHSALNSEEFLHISPDALEEVVCLDCLIRITERQVYEYCEKWARHQLQESEIESPSDEQIREKLGNVLYKIRFPVMSLEDFAELTAESTVLAEEEKNGVYVYMALGKRLKNLKFAAHERRHQEKENTVSRFAGVSDGWNCDVPMDAICIRTTVDVLLTGIGLYGGTVASTHNVSVTVLKGDETLSTATTTMTSDGRPDPFKIELKEPVHIHANTVCTVSALIKGPRTWKGSQGKDTYNLHESGGITFTASGMSTKGTDVTHGQIPQLFYFIE